MSALGILSYCGPKFKMFRRKRCASKFVDRDYAHFLVQFPFFESGGWLLLSYFLLFWVSFEEFHFAVFDWKSFLYYLMFVCWGENYGQLDFCSVVNNQFFMSSCLIRMFFIFSVNATFAIMYLYDIAFLDLTGSVMNLICLNHLFGC